MEHEISADGTRIAYERTGQGPPLLLVHGALSDHSRWDPLVEHIQSHFTTYAMDRRGRGESGDSEEYSIEREYEDIGALAHAIDSQVHVYGHSSGANYALEAAPKIENLSRLILYEADTRPSSEYLPPNIIDKIEDLINQGNHEEALITVMRELVEMSEDDIEHYRSLPSWPGRVASVHTFSREERSSQSYRFDPQRFTEFTNPVLLLVGSESPEEFRSSTEILHSGLPNSRIHVFSGQAHSADVVAPKMVASALIEFLIEG